MVGADGLGSKEDVRVFSLIVLAQFVWRVSRWWEPYSPRQEMRRQIEAIPRYIVTTETSEHRLFVWLRYPVLPDKNLIVIAREDDTTFGILHSRFHEGLGASARHQS